ncbi:MAG: alcohol dehydrogenase catalytic domain-containing protein [Christensenellaceae bacterium]|nr:alcohol dehydrogenase catalytic domain-containing protein [Christensenellaceae bacterium]
MLAARMYGANDLRVEEIPVPEVGDGEVLIKIKAAAVCGTDVRMLSFGASGIDESNPRVLGHEFAGIIDKVGKNVKGYKVGDRVAVAPNFGCGICSQCIKGNGHLCADYRATGINTDGGFAEYCLIPEDAVRGGNICLLQDDVSFEEGAINEPLSCVYNGFEHASVHPGDVVLVVGAGPIGIMHCNLALMAGAVVCLNDVSVERLENAKKIFPKLNIVSGNPEETVMKLSGNAGADVVITACPVPSVQVQALELAGIGGRVIFFGGIPAGKEPVGINTNLIHYKQLIVSGTTRASLSQYRKTLDFVSKKVLDVKPLITNYFTLSEIDKAFDYAKRGVGYKNVIKL